MKRSILLSAALFLCSIISAQNNGDFRTIKSGNWSDTSIWQKYTSGSWKAALAYPNYNNGAITIQDGYDVIINLNITLDQVKVQGGATLSLLGNYTVTLNNKSGGDDLISDGLINLSTGTITGAGTIRINGALQWVSGTIQSPLTNAGTITIDTGAPQNIVYLSGTITNNGIMNFVLGTIVFNNANSNIINNKIFTTSDANLFSSPSPTTEGTFTNNATGIFNVDNHGGFTSAIRFTNKGIMNFITSTGIFSNAYIFTNQKTMNFSNGAFINNDNCIANFNTGTSITGTGTMTIAGTINDNTNLNIQTNIAVFYGSNNLSFPITITGTGSLTINGDFVWYTGTIGVPVTISGTGSFTMSGNLGVLTSGITNNGIFTWGVGYYYFSNGSIVNNKTMYIIGDYEILNNGGSNSITNNTAGIITKKSYGTTTIDVPFTNKGVIAGAGIFNFGTNLTNTGRFAPGIDTATGILTTGQNYTNSTLSIKMNGTTPGIGFDRLKVNGNVALAGTLNVTSNTTMPAETYTILTCSGTLTGNFATKHLPPGYSVQIKPNSVVITVTQNLNTTDIYKEENMEVKTTALSVFPNPAANTLLINYPLKNTTAALRIFDATGNQVYQTTVNNGNNLKVNISRLIPGSYMLCITDGDKTETKKFIKQ